MMKTTCQLCGGTVLYTGMPWHRSCKPDCRVCGKPVHNWYDGTGSDIHMSCVRKARKDAVAQRGYFQVFE